MNGIVQACSNAAALKCVPSDMAGSAAAILGALFNMVVVLFLLFSLAVFADKTPATMTIIIAVAIFFFSPYGMVFNMKMLDHKNIEKCILIVSKKKKR